MAGQDAYYASVDMWAGTFAPLNWVFCYGQYLPINDNQALYSLIGSIYGGDDRTVFAVPDMRGRTPVGNGTGPALTERYLGEKGGAEDTILELSQMPSHNHDAVFTPVGAGDLSASLSLPVKTGFASGVNDPTDNYFGSSGNTNLYYSDTTAGATMAPVHVDLTGQTSGGTVTIGHTGGNPSGNTMPFSIMQPFTVLNFIICIKGLYPPRD